MSHLILAFNRASLLANSNVTATVLYIPVLTRVNTPLNSSQGHLATPQYDLTYLSSTHRPGHQLANPALQTAFISKDTKTPWQFRKMHKKLEGVGDGRKKNSEQFLNPTKARPEEFIQEGCTSSRQTHHLNTAQDSYTQQNKNKVKSSTYLKWLLQQPKYKQLLFGEV